LIGIDQAIEAASMSFDEFVRRTALPRARVEAIASGRWLPSPSDREAIARALGRAVNEISWGHTMSPRNVRYHRFGLPEDFAKG
jgi:hypothetical protein